MRFRAVSVLTVLVASLGAGAEQHVALNAAGRAALAAHRAGIAAAAPIYGYDLAKGSWTIQQLSCAAMPKTVMLRYTRRFPDGAESMFTVLAPRGVGTVTVVPVLYAGRTPFTPAPDNPRNVALFNRLVLPSTAQDALASRSQWRELGACYATMTGANAIAAPGKAIGVAGAPAPFLHLEARGKGKTLTLADRNDVGAYRLWTMRFNARGRLTTASVQNYVVPSTKTQEARAAATQTNAALPKTLETEPVPPASTEVGGKPSRQNARLRQTKDRAKERGWTFIRNPPEPSAKFIPNAPRPPAKFIPNPPGE